MLDERQVAVEILGEPGQPLIGLLVVQPHYPTANWLGAVPDEGGFPVRPSSLTPSGARFLAAHA